MLIWKGTKRIALLISAITLAILIGAGVVMAAQSHVVPFSAGNTTATHSQSSVKDDPTNEPTSEPTDESTPGQGESEKDQELVGKIQSVDQTGQTFVLVPDDGSAAVTIAFDAKTDTGQEDGGNGSNPLVVGAHITVEVVKRADGSLYAAEVELVSDGHGDRDGNGGGSDDGGSGSSGSNGGSGQGGSSGGSDDGGSGH